MLQVKVDNSLTTTTIQAITDSGFSNLDYLLEKCVFACLKIENILQFEKNMSYSVFGNSAL